MRKLFIVISWKVGVKRDFFDKGNDFPSHKLASSNFNSKRNLRNSFDNDEFEINPHFYEENLEKSERIF